jgi:hypothetical protein
VPNRYKKGSDRTKQLQRKKIILEAKRTHQIERKLFSKQSEHIRQKANYFQSEANTLDRKKIIFESKGTH